MKEGANEMLVSKIDDTISIYRKSEVFFHTPQSWKSEEQEGCRVE